MLADPIDEIANPRVGLTAGGIGDVGHLLQKRTLVVNVRIRPGASRGESSGLNGGFGLPCLVFFVLLGALVVGVWGLRQEGQGRAGRCARGPWGLFAGPDTFHGAPVDLEGACEGLDR